MISRQLFSLVVIALLLISGCSDVGHSTQPALKGVNGHTMGTQYSIRWPAHYELEASDIKPSVEKLLQTINQQMSTYQADSELSVFNLAPAPSKHTVSQALSGLIQESIDLHRLTDGYFDVSIGPLVNIWGFGPEEFANKAPSQEKVNTAKAQTGLEAISVDGNVVTKRQPRYVDLSAIAKGYGVDKVAELMEQSGVQSYLVEIGGEIRTKGVKAEGKPWRIAIEKPDAQGRSVQKILNMKTTGMATSGDYRNYFEVDGQRFSHTIDPNTGYPIRHKLASVTVLDPSCARADALATAMLVMGEAKAQDFARQQSIPAYFIIREGEGFKVSQSPAFDNWLSVAE